MDERSKRIFTVVLSLSMLLVVSCSQTPATGKTIAPGTTYSMAEVASHNNAQSCWLVIDGKVYDATDYLTRHPAGPDKILQTCGTDATDAFGGVGKHAGNRAQNDLASLYIGDLRG